MVDFTIISVKSKYSSHFVLFHSPPQIRWGEMVRWLKKQDLHLPQWHVCACVQCVCVFLCSSELRNLCDYYILFSTNEKTYSHKWVCIYTIAGPRHSQSIWNRAKKNTHTNSCPAATELRLIKAAHLGRRRIETDLKLPPPTAK